MNMADSKDRQLPITAGRYVLTVGYRYRNWLRRGKRL